MIDVTVIPECPSLDRVEVFWQNFEPGKGQVTIICYGSAWTSYFGAMSGQTIQEFFSAASVDYLASKLIDYRLQKKTSLPHIKRVVEAIKNHQSKEPQ